MHTLLVLFGWPDGSNGQVWPNILASIVTTAVIWLFGFRKLLQRQREHSAALHNHLNQLFTNLTDKKDA